MDLETGGRQLREKNISMSPTLCPRGLSGLDALRGSVTRVGGTGALVSAGWWFGGRVFGRES